MPAARFIDTGLSEFTQYPRNASSDAVHLGFGKIESRHKPCSGAIRSPDELRVMGGDFRAAVAFPANPAALDLVLFVFDCTPPAQMVRVAAGWIITSVKTAKIGGHIARFQVKGYPMRPEAGTLNMEYAIASLRAATMPFPAFTQRPMG